MAPSFLLQQDMLQELITKTDQQSGSSQDRGRPRFLVVFIFPSGGAQSVLLLIRGTLSHPLEIDNIHYYLVHSEVCRRNSNEAFFY